MKNPEHNQNALDWLLTDQRVRCFAPPARSVAHAVTELLEFTDAVAAAAPARIYDELPDLIWAYPALPSERQRDAIVVLHDAVCVIGPHHETEERRSLLKLIVEKWLVSGYKRAQLHAFLDAAAPRKGVVNDLG